MDNPLYVVVNRLSAMDMVSDHRPVAPFLQFQSSLQELTSVKVAIMLWEHPDIKDRILHHFNKIKNREIRLTNLKNWNLIVKQVLRNLHLINILPRKLKHDLESTIHFIGQKIFDWSEHVIFKLGFDVSYTEEIIWTAQGTIDEIAIFQNFWVNNKTLRLEKTCTFHDSPLYSLACMLGQVDIVYEFEEDMKLKTIKAAEAYYNSRHPIESINMKRIHLIMAIWLYFNVKKTVKKQFDGYPYFYNKNFPRNMFELFKMSLFFGYSKAVKYFFNKMNDTEKMHCVQRLDGNFLRKFKKYFNDNLNNFEKEKMVEIIIFLINNTPRDEIGNFLGKIGHSFLLQELLKWPFQNFFIQLIEEMAPSEFERRNIFLTVYKYCSTLREKYSMKNNFNLLKDLWKSLPTSYKINIINNRINVEKFQSDENFYPLRFMFYSPDLSGEVDLVRNEIENKIMNSIRKENFKPALEYFTAVLQPYVQLYNYDKLLVIVEKSTLKGKFYFANELLNSLIYSDEEKDRIKNFIDGTDFSRDYLKSINYLKPDYDSLNDFLTWRFDDSEDVKIVKSNLKDKDFIFDWFCATWAKCDLNLNFLKDKIDKCTKFLFWIFETEEKLNEFKRGFGMNLNLVKKFLDLLKEVPYFTLEHVKELIGEFFNFWLVPDDTIKKIKEDIISDVNIWIDTYGTELGRIQLIEALLFWAVEDPKEKLNIIGNYLKSREGVLLFCSIYNNSQNYPYESMTIFLNEWLRPTGLINHIKNELESLFGHRDKYTFLNALKGDEIVKSIDLMGILQGELSSYFDPGNYADFIPESIRSVVPNRRR